MEDIIFVIGYKKLNIEEANKVDKEYRDSQLDRSQDATNA